MLLCTQRGSWSRARGEAKQRELIVSMPRACVFGLSGVVGDLTHVHSSQGMTGAAEGGARPPLPPEHDEGPSMALHLPCCDGTTGEGSARSGATRRNRCVRGVAENVVRDALAAIARRGGVRGVGGAWETTGRREMRPMAGP